MNNQQKHMDTLAKLTGEMAAQRKEVFAKTSKILNTNTHFFQEYTNNSFFREGTTANIEDIYNNLISFLSGELVELQRISKYETKELRVLVMDAVGAEKMPEESPAVKLATDLAAALSNKRTELETQAFREGQIAFCEGKGDSDNKWAHGSQEWYSWKDGFKNAASRTRG